MSAGKRSGGDHRQDGKRQARRDGSGGTVAPGLQGGRRRPAHDGGGPADLDAAKLDQMQGRARRRQWRGNDQEGDKAQVKKAQAQASSAAVASAMQAYQSASALVRVGEIAGG